MVKKRQNDIHFPHPTYKHSIYTPIHAWVDKDYYKQHKLNSQQGNTETKQTNKICIKQHV